MELRAAESRTLARLVLLWLVVCDRLDWAALERTSRERPAVA